MTCKEAIYSDEVIDYLVDSYQGFDTLLQQYNPLCGIQVTNTKAVIFQEEKSRDTETIFQYGYQAVPHVYGLMSEETLESAGVLAIRRQPYLDLLGQNILVGIVDTGIDYTHPAFINADNTTRIFSIWDQTDESGEGVGVFPYGREYSREEINEALSYGNPGEIVPQRDVDGHGTFLAGVAAGNEEWESGFSGVAPLAELVVVKCKTAKKRYRDYYGLTDEMIAFQENDIMCGIAYLLRVARITGRKIAICLGVGTNLGNHNGESALCNMVDYFNSLPGVCIVTAAGNEGNKRHHTRLMEEEQEVEINVENVSKGFVTELWWRTPGTLFFDVISPSGGTLGLLRAERGLFRRKTFPLENTTVEIYAGTSEELSRDQVVCFRFADCKPGIWKIQVLEDFRQEPAHLWLPIRQFLEGEVYFLQPYPEETICEPGDSRRAICVTAYDWAQGGIWGQASRGFCPDGVVKPDIAAPGVEVFGPFPRGQYGVRSGTSVSAALTAGIAALFLQQYEQDYVRGTFVRELLIRGTSPAGDVVPNPVWGYGKVDAYQSLTTL